ncbi:MAG: VWA domain-containing protein [Candidatus Lokiarchaeota archaeon]|nr:VWA domain-containing protein [Candidatus Lokiarchaeota archaeon]
MSLSKRKKTKGSKKELTIKQKRIVDLAKIAWAETLKEFYYPPLNEPTYLFDYTHLEGFYIDPENQWEITMNLANTPLFNDDQEYIDYFHSISLHEVSHYQIIPYDGLTNAKLLRAAIENVNPNYAPIVVNVFADLIIDYLLYKKYPNLITWEVKVTYEHIKNKGRMSDFTKFLFRSYEKIWNLNLLNDDSLKSIDPLAERVSKVILKDFEDESTWEKKVSTVARHLNNLIQDSFTMVGKNVVREKGKEKIKSPGGAFIEVPNDVLEVMGNPLENKNSDKLKESNEDERRQKAEEFAKNIPYSEFGGPARQAGILLDGIPLATWYRGLAKNLIEIRILEEQPSGQLPVYPEVWRIGDRIEDLDIVQTLLNSPVIIPNLTTRKWAYEKGPGHLTEKQIPDLLLVLDSSGSMKWNYTSRIERGRGPYHVALVAAFAALHYAANKGVKFSVINFSNKADVCQWTADFKKAERVLLRYQGGGTVLPIDEIVQQCDKAERKALIFIITDFGIYNWSKSKKIMLDLAQRGHKIVGFFIGASKIPKDKFKTLLDKVTFYGIRDAKDLIDLVITEVKKYYL